MNFKKMDMGYAPLIVFILVITLGVVDLGLVVFGGTGSSASNALINIGFKSPIFVFMIGACSGHLFFSMWPDQEWSKEDRAAQRKRTAIATLCTLPVYEAIRTLVVWLVQR